MALPLTQTQPVHGRNDESPNTAPPTPYRSCCFNVTCSPVNGSSSHSVQHMPLEIQIEGHKAKKTHTAKHHAASMYRVVSCCDVFFTNKKPQKTGGIGPSFLLIQIRLISFFQFGRMSTWIADDQKSVGPAVAAKGRVIR